MIFEPIPLDGAWVVTLDPIEDERGYYARAYCRKEFEAHGIDPTVVQVNAAFSKSAGTLRGMHYQTDPCAETKLVRCVRGSLYDVMVDMRPDSPTYLQHFGIELSAANRKMVFVPKSFAHGFLTLKDNTELCYMVGEYYAPGCEQGFCHDDPAVGIQWPVAVEVISEKDKSWPPLKGIET